MKRLSPAKRNQLILVVVITLTLISAVYFFLISPQNIENNRLKRQTSDQLADLDKYKKLISQAETTSNQLVAVSQELNHAEQDIATGDVYAWTYDTLRRFKANYHLNIPTIGQPSVSDVDLIPNFPYRQVRLSLNGSGYYHDLGKFVADFENDFPHMRLVNLTMQSDNDTTPEVLTFQMDVVALIKPNS
jgi:Tfp pilus assembly protein PilO